MNRPQTRTVIDLPRAGRYTCIHPPMNLASVSSVLGRHLSAAATKPEEDRTDWIYWGAEEPAARSRIPTPGLFIYERVRPDAGTLTFQEADEDLGDGWRLYCLDGYDPAEGLEVEIHTPEGVYSRTYQGSEMAVESRWVALPDDGSIGKRSPWTFTPRSEAPDVI